MAFVEWDQKYSVKVAEIDAQHREPLRAHQRLLRRRSGTQDDGGDRQGHRIPRPSTPDTTSIIREAHAEVRLTGTPQQMASHKAFRPKRSRTSRNATRRDACLPPWR